MSDPRCQKGLKVPSAQHDAMGLSVLILLKDREGALSHMDRLAVFNLHFVIQCSPLLMRLCPNGTA